MEKTRVIHPFLFAIYPVLFLGSYELIIDRSLLQ